ncbi:MAG: dihydroxy-acid dehydratase, partial [Rubripirellula sp.]
YLSFGKDVALITDARFSGVSTGACIGHVGPEALAGGPIAKVRDGDMIDIVVDCQTLEGHVNLIAGHSQKDEPPEQVLASRSPHPNLRVDPN